MVSKKLLFAIVLILIVGVFGFILISKNKSTQVAVSVPTPTPNLESTQKPMPQNSKTWDKAPAMSIDPTKKYAALIKTSEGNIVVDLDARATPITVNNFVFLAKNNFYDNTIFHRVVKNFMIQGGDPLGDGTGGPGYTFDDEPITKDYKRGTVAMANRGPNTNGSQFFIMHQDYPLSKNYVIFGSVSNGLDALDKIANADVVTAQSGELSKPVNPVQILTIEINEY